MADKFLIVVQAGPQELAKALHALLYGQELHEAGYNVQIIFDGAGTTWVKEFKSPEHKYFDVYQHVEKLGIVAGACEYCGNAFGVVEQVKEAGVPLWGEAGGHPSLVKYVKEGYVPIVL